MALLPRRRHPIFDDILCSRLEAVQQRVRADAGVLEERYSFLTITGDHTIDGYTPLLFSIFRRNPAIALWLLEHRGQQGLEVASSDGETALYLASTYGQLEVVQTLVAAGADPAVLDVLGYTPLMGASLSGQTDIVAFLLQLPDVKATIDHVAASEEEEDDDDDDDDGGDAETSALSLASFYGHQPIVQLLLDAGANPTVPGGRTSPLDGALNSNNHAIAALLRHAIAEAERARALCRALYKARSLLGAGAGISGGLKDTGLCEDLYKELLGYMLPLWADKGPAGV